MFSKKYYSRRKIGGRVSNVIFRILAFILAVCLLGVILYGAIRCLRNVNTEIDKHTYKP